MLNIIQNTIGAIRRVGESVVRAGLKMWLPFTKAEPLGEELIGDSKFANNGWWGLDSNWDILDGKAVSNGSSGTIYKGNVLNVQKTYLATITLSAYTSGTLTYPNIIGGGQVIPNNINTPFTFKFIPSSKTTSLTSLNFNGSVSSFSVEEYAQETPDISGNDNDAILKTGKALVFDGNDSVETSFPSSKTIKTIAFWIYPTHSANFETLFNLGITNIPVSPLGDRVIQLNHLTISNKSNYPLNFDVYIDGVYRGETNYNGDNPTLLLNQWQRVVLVNSNGTSTVNDTFDVAYTGSGSHGRFKMSDLQIYGADWTTDDIAYDYANPQKLVTDNASSSVTLNDLHAWWHMSEGDGTIAFDSAPLIGDELVVNGDFEDGISGWTPTSNANLSINNGKLRVTSEISGFEQGYQYVSVEAGKTYRLTGEVYYVSGTIGWLIVDAIVSGSYHQYGLASVNSSNTTNSLDITFTALTSAVTIKGQTINTTSGLAVEIDNISLKEVFNIDGETYDGSSLGATYDDAQERIPQLGMMNWSKGSNVLTYSEDFSNSEWSKVNSPTLESGYLAPDGTMTAYKITKGISNSHIVDLNVQTTTDNKTKSVWAKTVSGTGVVSLLNYYGNNNSQYTLTEEWQRVEVSGTLNTNEHFYLVDFRHASNTLDEVILWGAQLESDDGSVTAYRRTNGTAVTDATLISSATDSQKDILGNAVRVKGSGFNLDGTGYGEVLHNTDFDFGTGDFSVSAWVKFSYVAKGSSFNAIYTNGGQVDGTNTFSLISHSVMKIMFFVNTTDCQSTTTFNHGEWVYVVATRNSGTISLYINGNKTPEQTRSTVNSNATVTSSQNPTIGFDNTDSRLYNDIIDDVQVYDRYLTPDEVEQNYNATKSGHNN